MERASAVMASSGASASRVVEQRDHPGHRQRRRARAATSVRRSRCWAAETDCVVGHEGQLRAVAQRPPQHLVVAALGAGREALRSVRVELAEPLPVGGHQHGRDPGRRGPAGHHPRDDTLLHQLAGEVGPHHELGAHVGPALRGEQDVGQHHDQQQHRGQHGQAQRRDPAAEGDRAQGSGAQGFGAVGSGAVGCGALGPRLPVRGHGPSARNT